MFRSKSFARALLHSSIWSHKGINVEMMKLFGHAIRLGKNDAECQEGSVSAPLVGPEGCLDQPLSWEEALATAAFTMHCVGA